MLHRPPGGGHAADELAEAAHRHAEGRAAVHVVVRQPAGQRVAHRVREDGAEGRQPARAHREGLRDPQGGSPRHQLLQLAAPVWLVPAVGHQLRAQLAEGVRRLHGRRHVDRRRLAPRKPLDHAHAFVRVEAVHDLRRVRVLVRVDPVRAGRVRHAPVGQVVPLVVYPHVEPLLCDLCPLRRRELGRRGNRAQVRASHAGGSPRSQRASEQTGRAHRDGPHGRRVEDQQARRRSSEKVRGVGGN